MPELPEVETVIRILNPIIKGRTIKDIIIYREANINTGAKQFKEILIGKTFESVERKGKYLLFNISDNYVVLSHLRMEGKYFETEVGKKIDQHDIFAYQLDNGKSLVYNDVRKFGEVGLYKKDRLYLDSSLKVLGKEPFEITTKELFDHLKNKTCTIKEAIMDQHIIAGIGNIYADEVLFATSINPRTKASEISYEQCDQIIKEAIRILTEAIEEGGSTIKSYHPKEGISGKMQNKLMVYSRGGMPCFKCKTKLRRITIGGRSSVFCPKCQKQIHAPLIFGVTGPIHSGKSTVSKLFEQHGFIRFDADAEAKKIYLLPNIKKRINKLFGQDVYLNDHPHSQLIRSLIANNPSLKEDLNKIIHPYVFKAAEKLIKSKDDNSKIVLDVPLLFTSKMDYLCDYIIYVDSPLEERKNRLISEGKDYQKLMSINTHYPFALSKKESSFIINNDSDINNLKSQLTLILDHFL